MEDAFDDPEDVNDGLKSSVYLGCLSLEESPIRGIGILLTLLPPPQLLQMVLQLVKYLANTLQLLQLNNQSGISLFLEAKGIE